MPFRSSTSTAGGNNCDTYGTPVLILCPIFTQRTFSTTVPEASAPTPTSSIPDWADSLIHLASDNAAAIQDLKAENQHLRDLLNEVLTTNKKLREELTKVLHGVNSSPHGIKYQPSEPNAESIPMAAELKK
jgi:hypothetical protein